MAENIKKRGKFIVFEGLDGSGSSTHSILLKESLKNIGVEAITTKEPTNNLVGGLIRGALTNEWETSAQGLQLLFAADRAHHLKRLIEPNLEKGKYVLCDRYMYSTIAYGAADFKDTIWLKEINKFFLKPDLVILLKVDPKECLRRINTERAETELFEKVDYLTKTWAEYEKIAEENDFFKIIDAMRPKEEVKQEIWEYISKL